MCLNCGCDLPDEDWENPDNITVASIKKATATPKSMGLSADQVMNRIYDAWEKVPQEDKNFRSGPAVKESVGDTIADLMDGSMRKSDAVDKAEHLHANGYSDKMKAVKKRASSY